MSIIYDALQKTQQTREKKIASSLPWVTICLLIIIACLLIVVISAYYPQIKKYFSFQSSVALPTVRAPATYQGNLVLNGVLLSNQEKIAMINNQAFHVGDTVDGLQVVDIQSTSVKLQNDKNMFILQITA